MITAKRIVARSALVTLAMTLARLVLGIAKSQLAPETSARPPEQLVGLLACYVAAAFTFALGFFLAAKQLPGRTSTAKGLRYSLLVFLAVWVSGFPNLFAIDFEGGWNPFGASRLEVYWMAVCDFSSFVFGGLLLGFVTRRDALPPVFAPFTSNLAARMAVGAALLPALWAGLFYVAALALPTGHDLSGTHWKIFYFFLFAPLMIAGAGHALLHAGLRSRGGHGILADAARLTLFIFGLYWVPNVLFVLFLGFTWQSVLDFLIAGGPAVYLSILSFELLARLPPQSLPIRGSPEPSGAT